MDPIERWGELYTGLVERVPFSVLQKELSEIPYTSTVCR